MAKIYNLLFKAPTALTLNNTLHSHYIGAVALGHLLVYHWASLHSQAYKATGPKWVAHKHEDQDTAGTELTTVIGRPALPSELLLFKFMTSIAKQSSDRWFRTDIMAGWSHFINCKDECGVIQRKNTGCAIGLVCNWKLKTVWGPNQNVSDFLCPHTKHKWANLGYQTQAHPMMAQNKKHLKV